MTTVLFLDDQPNNSNRFKTKNSLDNTKLEQLTKPKFYSTWMLSGLGRGESEYRRIVGLHGSVKFLKWVDFWGEILEARKQKTRLCIHFPLLLLIPMFFESRSTRNLKGQLPS